MRANGQHGKHTTTSRTYDKDCATGLNSTQVLNKSNKMRLTLNGPIYTSRIVEQTTNRLYTFLYFFL